MLIITEVLLLLLFTTSVSAIFPGNCTHHTCENDAICVDQYEVIGLPFNLCNGLSKLVDASSVCPILGYTCQCRSNFRGERCEISEIETDELLPGSCAEDSCEDSLICQNHYEASNGFLNWLCNNLESMMVDGMNSESCKVAGHTCDCPIDVSDKEYSRCHKNRKRRTTTPKPDLCKSSPCENGGTCINIESSYTCSCPLGFAGQNCTEILNQKHIAKYLGDQTSCAISSCEAKKADGNCDEECNFFACGFDGGDCSARTEPFEKCPTAEYCSAAFADGICDEICNSETCFFDGRDCEPAPSFCPYEDLCRKTRNNGICELQCHTVECGYDEDCVAPEEKKMLNESLSVVVLGQPEEFIPKLNDFLYNMTLLVRVSVVLKEDENGPMIFKWKDGKSGQRLNTSKVDLTSFTKTRGDRSSIEGIVLTLGVDNSSCLEDCFTNVVNVASFIGNAVSRKNPLIESLKIYKAEAIHTLPPPPQAASLSWKDVVIGIFVVCSLLSVIVGVVIQSTGIWIPPKENEFLDRNPANEDLPLAKYGQLILPEAQLKTVHTHLTQLHAQASSNQAITFPVNPLHVNLKIGVQGNTPLHLLVINSTKNQELILHEIQNLYWSRADLNAQNELGETALYLACRYGKTQAAIKLLSLGADPSVRSKSDSTPLHQAAVNNDLRTIEEILKYESVRKTINQVDSFHRTPLEGSIKHAHNSVKVAERLINVGAKMDHSGEKCDPAVCGRRSALHWAVEASNLQMIKFLIRRYSKKDALDSQGRTPIFLAVELNNIEVVKLLIEMGTNHELVDQREFSPKEFARSLGLNDIVELLEACPKYELPTAIETTPRIPVVRNKRQTKRKNTDAIVGNSVETTPQLRAKKTKKSNKINSILLTPPTSDESTANTPAGIPETSSFSNRIQMLRADESMTDSLVGYSHQGLKNGYYPNSSESETSVSMLLSPSISNTTSSSQEDTIASNFIEYLNYDDEVEESNYMNL